MLVVREVLNCKPGKVGELKKKFQALAPVMQRVGLQPFRLMTDLCGEPFWTLVAETEVPSVNEFLEAEDRIMAEPDAQKIMVGYHDLILSGRREIFRLEPGT